MRCATNLWTTNKADCRICADLFKLATILVNCCCFRMTDNKMLHVDSSPNEPTLPMILWTIKLSKFYKEKEKTQFSNTCTRKPVHSFMSSLIYEFSAWLIFILANLVDFQVRHWLSWQVETLTFTFTPMINDWFNISSTCIQMQIQSYSEQLSAEIFN